MEVILENRDLLEENERLKQNIEILELQLQASNDCIEEMRHSVSWKVTAPIRYIKTHCTPLREMVGFVRQAKKDGLSATLHEGKVLRYQNKHRFAKKILKSEFKKQVAQRGEIPINYYVFIEITNFEDASFDEMLASIVGQTILPKKVYVKAEDKWKDGVIKDIIHKYNSSVPVELVSDFAKASIEEKISDSDMIISIWDYAVLAENYIYELEQIRKLGGIEIIYTDDVLENKDSPIYRYKPDFAPHYAMSENYFGSVLGILGKIWQNKVGSDSSEKPVLNYEIMLSYGISCIEKDKENDICKKVYHISRILYKAKELSDDMVVKEALTRKQCLEGKENWNVISGLTKNSGHIVKEFETEPLVSILIPTYEHMEDLKLCITSIKEKTTYKNYEILIIENNSKEEAAFAYYKELEKDSKIRMLYWDGSFNYSAINNYGVSYAKGEYLIFLNNDIEVISENWIQEMLFYAEQKSVGAVGTKLYFSDETIQHAGVILGIRRLAGHGHRNFKRSDFGYMNRLMTVQNYSVVTAACMMIQKSKFLAVHGFDEQLAVDFNDVDLCMKLRKDGLYNVFTPYAELYHYESKSRGENITPEQKARNEKEFYYFNTKWYKDIVAGDSFYNKNLTLLEDDFSFKKKRENHLS